MKKLVLLSLFILLCIPVNADQFVNGYYRKNGTYVQPHYRSRANYTKFDNYSTRGNYNPYTGQRGSQNPYNMSQYNYQPLPTYEIPKAKMLPTPEYSAISY